MNTTITNRSTPLVPAVRNDSPNPDFIKQIEAILTALSLAENQIFYISIVVSIIALFLLIGAGVLVFKLKHGSLTLS